MEVLSGLSKHLRLLGNKENYSFSRWGDGEFNAIWGMKGVNCDKHTYFPDMGHALTSILKKEQRYKLGLQPLIADKAFKKIDMQFPDKQWINADVFHIASIEDEFYRVFEILSERSTILVGPGHLRDLMQHWSFIEVPKLNCWLHKDVLLAKIESRLNGKKDVCVLLCAGMPSNVMIDILFDKYGTEHTFLDMGSVFDPYVGIKSRTYHKAIIEREFKLIE